MFSPNTTANSLKDREVVNVCDGRRIGFVCDFGIDIVTGRICSLIVPGEFKVWHFGKRDDYIIPWDCITRIGDEIILVNVPSLVCERQEKKEKCK